jgi:uncharacterized protein (DUF1330 family)
MTTPHITPTREQLERLAQRAGSDDGPIVMLNLLRFAGAGGRESYANYGSGVQTSLQKAGGRVLWQGRADQVVIGDDEGDGWDAVILVEYPSRKAFLDMIASREYRDVGQRRTNALVDSRLIACTEQFRAEA